MGNGGRRPLAKTRQAPPTPTPHREGRLPTRMLDEKFTENGQEACSAKLQKKTRFVEGGWPERINNK